MRKRKTWWAYSLDETSVEFLRDRNPLTKSIIGNLESYSESGALFVSDKKLDKRINKIVHLKSIFDVIKKRGHEDRVSCANSISVNNEHGSSIEQITECEIAQIPKRRIVPGLHLANWNVLEKFIQQFLIPDSNRRLQILVVDKFAISGRKDEIVSRKMKLIAKMCELLSEFCPRQTKMEREIKLIHSPHRNNYDYEKCFDMIGSKTGKLKNRVTLRCVMSDDDLHSRYFIWPWWTLNFDKGLDTLTIDENDRMKLSNPDAPVFLTPWPTKPKMSLDNVQTPNREALKLARLYWDYTEGKTTIIG